MYTGIYKQILIQAYVYIPLKAQVDRLPITNNRQVQVHAHFLSIRLQDLCRPPDGDVGYIG